MFDSSPDSIVARLSRRDESVPSDRFGVYLDPYHDERSGYYFLVNAAGTQFDGTLSTTGTRTPRGRGVGGAGAPRRAGLDGGVPDPVLAGPLPRRRLDGVGLNLRRVIMRRNEQSFLAYQPRNESGFVSRFPDLVNLNGVRGRARSSCCPTPPARRRSCGTRRSIRSTTAATSRRAAGSTSAPAWAASSRSTQRSSGLRPGRGGSRDRQPERRRDLLQEKRPFFVEGASNFRFGNEGANSYWNIGWPEPSSLQPAGRPRPPGRRGRKRPKPYAAAYGDVRSARRSWARPS